MGIFDFLFGSKKKSFNDNGVPGATESDQLLSKVTVEPAIEVTRAFAEHWPLIIKTGLSCVSITASPASELRLEQSKFGSYPYLPADFEYPRDVSGECMFPLAQINCEELPQLSGYPDSGYLQFYISVTDDLMGLDFDDPQSQKNFRVLYFEEEDFTHYKADFSFLDPVMQSDTSPVFKPHSLEFSLKKDYVGIGDVRYEEKGSFKIDHITKLYPSSVQESLEDAAYSDFSCNGHKMGGYAFFTQEDPRMHNEKFRDYILLLQIDTDDEIMWGDSGVANFFIHPDDLAKKDFSKVMYNWDCC